MAGAKIMSLSCLYAFLIVGFVGLNIARAQNNTTTPAPTTNNRDITTESSSALLPITVSPATGYGHFNVSSCILLDISCSVSVDLHVGNSIKTVSYDLPTNAIASGNCGDKESSITLSWTEGVANLALSMMLENGDSKWETSSLAFTANAGNQTLIINGTEKEVSAWQNDTSNLKMTAGSGKSFKCKQDQDITLQGNNKVTVVIKKMQLQPFNEEDKAVFGEADVCFANSGQKPAEPIDTVVPTAVGCVLAGLVVILIITYFVGRCKRPGYKKM